MKNAFCMLMISLLFVAGPVSAQPPGYSSDTDTGGGDGGGGGSRDMKIALAWGEQLKPPARYLRFIINLRDAMIRWGGSSPEILGQFRIGSPDLMKLTVLFISADQAFEITDTEKKNLQSFIAKGGLIVVDDASASMPNSASAASLSKMIKDIAGSKRLAPVPNSHEIYTIPNMLGGPPQGSDNSMVVVQSMSGSTEIGSAPSDKADDSVVKGASSSTLQGITINGRLAILFCTKGYTPKWNENSNNDPQLKFGVNLIRYGASTRK